MPESAHSPVLSPSALGNALEVSIIIPVWNESDALWVNCRRWLAFDGVKEIVLAVAGRVVPPPSMDPRLQIVQCPDANRGAQQKRGASMAAGTVLLFHHADSDLRAEHVRALLTVLGSAQGCAVVGGAFVRAFDERHPWLTWVQHLAAWQQKYWGALYGDQSIFARRAHYEAIGGFAAIPLMEDVEFSGRLRRSGKIALLRPPLGTSARRHTRQGSWRTSVRNGTLLLLYRFGVSPFRLHRWYYRELATRSILALIWSELICRRAPVTTSPAETAV